MNFIQFITTRRFLKHFLLSVGIVVVLLWAILMLLKIYTRHGETVKVPNVVGMNLAHLSELETIKYFNVEVIDSVYDYRKKPGTIVSQIPPQNSIVKKGRTVYISVISTLPDQVKMPALVDLSLRQAKALLQTYDLQLGTVRKLPDMAKNAVLRVTYHGKVIKPGTLIDKGSFIDLYVGSGQGSAVNIPFFIGMSRAEALSEIDRLGLVLGNEEFSGSSDEDNAKVFEQSPGYAFGKRVSAGTSISLIYKTDNDLNFDEYINNLEIDTVRADDEIVN